MGKVAEKVAKEVRRAATEYVLAKAKSMGFYDGNRIRPGAVFKVVKGHAGNWFDVIDPLDRDGNGKRGGRRKDNAPVDTPAGDLKADPEKNDNLNAAGEKVGEKADVVEDEGLA